MFRIEKILVPTDFSGNSLIALEQAGDLARRFQAQITLLHVDEFPGAHFFAKEGAADRTARAAHLSERRKQLNAFGTAELEGLAVKRMVCCGDPAKVIVMRAKEEQSDLILMPARGGGVFRRFLLGSVTAKVLHDAECPVWTGVHREEPPDSGHAEIRHVLCAVDFGPQSNHTVRWAAGFSSEVGATLTVVHAVLETPPNLPDRYAFQWHEESHCGASERLHELLLDCGAKASVLVVSDGDVPKSLATAVKQTRADLLVIGRSEPGSAAGRPGSQTFPIVCRAPCPVVSL